jgi:hypothetical protein
MVTTIFERSPMVFCAGVRSSLTSEIRTRSRMYSSSVSFSSHPPFADEAEVPGELGLHDGVAEDGLPVLLLLALRGPVAPALRRPVVDGAGGAIHLEGDPAVELRHPRSQYPTPAPMRNTAA